MTVDPDDVPTVVVNEVSYDGGETAHRVIFCESADVFGAEGDHVAEGIAASTDEVDDVLQDLELEVRGWDAVDADDLGWLWEHRPDRVSEWARLFGGAVLADSDIPEYGETAADIPASGEESTHIRADDGCHHLDDYLVDGECLRCEQRFNTGDERYGLE